MECLACSTLVVNENDVCVDVYKLVPTEKKKANGEVYTVEKVVQEKLKPFCNEECKASYLAENTKRVLGK